MEQSWWPEWFVRIKGWVKMSEVSEMNAPLPYDEPLKSQTISHLRLQVGMAISYRPKMDDQYH